MPVNLLGWILLILGLAFAVPTVRTLSEFKARSESATARINRYESVDGGDFIENVMELRMELPDGRHFEMVEDKAMADRGQPYPVGTVLRVKYNPQNPQDFSRATPPHRMLQIKLIGLFAFVCLAGAALFGLSDVDQADLIVSLPAAEPPAGAAKP